MGAFVLAVSLRGPAIDPADLLCAIPWLPPARDGHEHGSLGRAAFVRSSFFACPENRVCSTPSQQDGPVCLVDGRIDNREDLRSALGLHPTWRGSDAELISRAYARWGPDCADRFRGDFALALWDERHETLFLASDPLGGRCMRYWSGADRLIVGSRTRAVGAAAPSRLHLNRAAFVEYLRGETGRWTRETSLEGVNLVPAGYHRVFTVAGSVETRYCTLGNRAESYVRPDDYVDRFAELLDRAVKRRLRAVGPVAATLSGGLDSTSVAVLAAKAVREAHVPGPLHTHSLVFPQSPDMDESEFQQATWSAWPEMSPHTHDAEPLWSYRGVFDDASYCVDEVEVGLAHRELRYCVARAAVAHGARVLLVGSLGDHVLGPCAGRALLIDAPWHQWVRELRRLVRVRGLAASGREAAVALVCRSAPSFDPVRRHRGVFARPSLGTHGSDLAYAGIFDGLSLLRRRVMEDYGASAGVEVRDPFQDRDLVEFALHLPPLLRVGGDVPKFKPVLREAMKGILPEIVRSRRRRTHFNEVLPRGILHERARLDCVVRRSEVAERGWIPRDVVLRAWQAVATGDVGSLQLIVRLLEVESRLKGEVEHG